MKKYKFSFSDTEIVFRCVNAIEADRYYTALKAYDSNYFIEESIFLQITENINEKDINNLPAGIIPTVVYLSLKLSGVLKSEEDLIKKLLDSRENIKNNFFSQAYIAIIKYQPSYTVDMLKEKTVDELFELIAISEELSGQELFNISQENNKSKKPKTTGGVKNITPEEINIVKEMIGLEENNVEIF